MNLEEVKLLSPEEMFEKNTGLVGKVVNGMLARVYATQDSHGFNEEDIKQLGYMGLWKACLGFKHEMGFKFSTYAVPKIFGEIVNGFRNGELISISRDVKIISGKIAKNGKKLSIEEIMKDYGCSKKIAIEINDYLSLKYISTQLPVNNDGEGDTILEEILEDYNSDFEEELIKKIELEKRLSIIDEDARQAILLSLEGKTQREIGSIMCINQVRVSRITLRALDKINKHYNLFAV